MSDGGTIGKQGMVGGEDKKAGVLTLKVNSGEEATLDLTGKKDWAVGEIAVEGGQCEETVQLTMARPSTWVVGHGQALYKGGRLQRRPRHMGQAAVGWCRQGVAPIAKAAASRGSDTGHRGGDAVRAQRNRETTFLGLEFHAGGAGDEGGPDLSQETFFCSSICQGKVSSLHGLSHG
ncbi:hypothetical protein B296_00050001 [Ensete ventricosum]|uniref:Uncharacterized protein n=1 Tax=Ensete ventricosum TaxID=4639 RepID=A0A426XD92_ENSVE|nr:hypothetical protein B296_00050001 [Ensete ventricosum]